MSLKKYNSTTPGQRQLVLVKDSSLHKGRPYKKLTTGKKKTGGRNNMGRITSRHIGGGHKKLYRIIDFKRNNKMDVEATVLRIEYDPNRTANIALIEYADDQSKAYIIAPESLKAGDKVISSNNEIDVKVGNSMLLKNIPVGGIIHNVELKPNCGAQLARSAGSYVQLAGKDAGKAMIKLRSGELRVVDLECRATIGVVSNSDHQNIKLGKAGRKRWLGRRPKVRGVAMNPIDHPLGGGEGKSAGGRHPVSPWGQKAKGLKTRRNKRTSKFIIKKRNKK